MTPYETILVNSLQSSFLLSLRSENAWFAAMQFGGFNLWFITLAAIIGSFSGNLINFSIGWYIAKKRNDWFYISDGVYQRLTDYFRYIRFLLLLPLPFILITGQFYSIFVFLNGFFSKSMAIPLLLVLVGRIIFYSYYIILN